MELLNMYPEQTYWNTPYSYNNLKVRRYTNSEKQSNFFYSAIMSRWSI